jgi:hypothetical protein
VTSADTDKLYADATETAATTAVIPSAAYRRLGLGGTLMLSK